MSDRPLYADLPGLATIRVDAGKSPIVNFFRGEYAPHLRDKPLKTADILVSFAKDRLPAGAYKVRPPVSYDKRGVFLFDMRDRLCRVDWDGVGKPGLKVSCDPEFDPHFFAIVLEYLLHLSALPKGGSFCHSAAFQHRGKTVLCPAWRNVGKTNLLLAFLEDGAQYIADDWSLLGEDGAIRSLSKRLNLFHYNFLGHPRLVESLGQDFKHLVEFTDHAMGGRYDLDPADLQTLRQKLRLRLTPEELCGRPALVRSERVDAAFWLAKSTRTDGQVIVSDMSAEQLFASALETLRFEQTHFRLAYAVHRAQTGRVNPFLERSDALEAKILRAALGRARRVYRIETPGQEKFPDVKAAIERVLAS